MNNKNNFFISIIASFLLLIFSLYLSYENISANTKMVKSIEKDQIKLSYLSNKLNYDIKANQANILQLIILKDSINIEK